MPRPAPRSPPPGASESLADTAGRDTAGIVAAAASGDVDALVVGGVDPPTSGVAGAADALRPARSSSRSSSAPSAVTAVADVVLPVAAHAEKAGTFVNWEGRVRTFEAALDDQRQVSDYRALDMLADEMGEFLGTRTRARGPRRDGGPRPVAGRPRRAPRPSTAGDVPQRRGGHAGPRHLAPPARPRAAAGRRAVPRRHRPGAGRPGVGRHGRRRSASSTATRSPCGSAAPTVTAPVLVTEMADHVVWLPTNSAGSRPCGPPSAVTPGAVVSVTKGGAA